MYCRTSWTILSCNSGRSIRNSMMLWFKTRWKLFLHLFLAAVTLLVLSLGRQRWVPMWRKSQHPWELTGFAGVRWVSAKRKGVRASILPFWEQIESRLQKIIFLLKTLSVRIIHRNVSSKCLRSYIFSPSVRYKLWGSKVVMKMMENKTRFERKCLKLGRALAIYTGRLFSSRKIYKKWLNQETSSPAMNSFLTIMMVEPFPYPNLARGPTTKLTFSTPHAK